MTPGHARLVDVVREHRLDDHEVARRGLRELLDREAVIDVVGESGSAKEAARRIPARAPTSRSSTAGFQTAP